MTIATTEVATAAWKPKTAKMAKPAVADHHHPHKAKAKASNEASHAGHAAKKAAKSAGHAEGMDKSWGKYGAEAMKNAMTTKMADYFTEKVSAPPTIEEQSLDVAKEIIRRLDADMNGSLNSEEIAGTRLAEKIAEGFYGLDGDKTGTLDVDELYGFILEELKNQTVAETVPDEASGDTAEAAETPAEAPVEAPNEAPAEAPEAVVADPEMAPAEEAVEAAAPVETAETPEAAPAEAAAAPIDVMETVDYYVSPAMSAEERIIAAFEAALRTIQEGQEARSTYDVVSALYGDVQGIIGST